MMTRYDITMRTIVDLPEEQLRKLAALCRKENISRAEAVRRAVGRLLQGAAASDLKAYFGASKTKGSVSRRVAKMRGEWPQPS
jgi:metal-responsive CopG/Arc/MetJ family transcriptional regulator